MLNETIQNLIDRNALFVVNHSGGKDSQAMFIKLMEIVPEDQVLVIHADLPDVEWEGTEQHVRDTIGEVPLVVCRAIKTFMEMVDSRQMWPSPKYRQCTSDLKRGPIEKAIRHHLKQNPQFDGLVVNCMGLRSEESSQRAKAVEFKFNPRNSKAGREWYDWLPIHDMLIDEVWSTIQDAGQEPHWAYREGMSRLSCCFCIMASKDDLTLAALLNPEKYREYVEKELEIDQTFTMPVGGVRRFLPEVTGVTVDEAMQMAA